MVDNTTTPPAGAVVLVAIIVVIIIVMIERLAKDRGIWQIFFDRSCH
jgi:hypothetical protein